jgi:hypothetical protein
MQDDLGYFDLKQKRPEVERPEVERPGAERP